MPSPVVLRDPSVKIEFQGGTVDLSDWATAFEPSSEADTVDLGTFSNPKATDLGRVTDGITVSLLWAPELVTALSSHINEEGTFRGKYDKDDTNAVTATVKYATLPWGSFTVGERVEVDLQLAVLDEITYETDGSGS